MTQPSTDPKLKDIVKSFGEAIRKLDETEPEIRNLIEVTLADITSKTGSRVKGRSKVVKELTAKIVAIRAKAIKAAFRHLRDSLPSHNGL